MTAFQNEVLTMLKKISMQLDLLTEGITPKAIEKKKNRKRESDYEAIREQCLQTLEKACGKRFADLARLKNNKQ